MKKIKKRLLAGVAGAALMFNVSNAQAIIPTIDIANLIQSILSVIESWEDTINQIEQIENQYTQIQEAYKRYEQLVVSFENASGNYGIGDLFNSDEFKKARRELPDNWNKTLDILEDGETDAGESARRSMEAGQRFLAEDIYADDITAAERYRRAKKQLYGKIGMTQAAYNRVETQLDTVEGLIEKIDQNPDQKALDDLNARIAGEQAAISVEKTRIDAIATLNDLEQREETRERRALDAFLANPEIPEILIEE